MSNSVHSTLRKAAGLLPLALLVPLALSRGIAPAAPAQDPPKAAPAAQAWKPWKLETPNPKRGKHVEKNDRFTESKCYACHREVTEEWAGTLHAVSWLDDIYQEELKDRKKPESCHGCHIPQPLLAGDLTQRATPRKDDLHFGVSCESCHLGPAGEILGPRGTETEAHPTRKSEHMVANGSDALCANCHRVNIGPVIGVAKDFEASNQASQGKSCVGCHMAPLERRWANPAEGAGSSGSAAGAGGEAPLRLGRSHAIQTPRDPAFLRRAFEFQAKKSDKGTVVTIANQAGHRVPGLSERRIEFEVRVFRADDFLLAAVRKVVDSRAFLPVGGSIQVEVPATGDKVQVVGVHFDPRLGLTQSEGVTFCADWLPAP